MGKRLFETSFNSFGHVPRCGMPGSYSNFSSNFLRSYHTVFHSTVPFRVCTNGAQGLHFSRPLKDAVQVPPLPESPRWPRSWDGCLSCACAVFIYSLLYLSIYLLFLNPHPRICLLIFEREEGERKREKNIDEWLPPACALTRDWTCNFLAYGMMLYPTEPPGQVYTVFIEHLLCTRLWAQYLKQRFA